MEKIKTIYCFTNLINNKQYIGSTVVKPNIRYNQHIYNAFHENVHQYNYPLYQAIRKYGIENFKFEILYQFECSENEIREKEKEYILNYNTLSPNGYNQTTDTQHPLSSSESYKKMSQTKRDKAKCVAEIDSDGNLINIWNSIVDCAEQEHLHDRHIASCCRGERHTVDNKMFCWIDDNGELLIPEYVGAIYKGKKSTTQKQITNRKVAKIDLKTNIVIEEYDSIALASRENNCDGSAISKVCKGLRKSCGNFGWKYIED